MFLNKHDNPLAVAVMVFFDYENSGTVSDKLYQTSP